jgi:hypothetical protein
MPVLQPWNGRGKRHNSLVSLSVPGYPGPCVVSRGRSPGRHLDKLFQWYISIHLQFCKNMPLKSYTYYLSKLILSFCLYVDFFPCICFHVCLQVYNSLVWLFVPQKINITILLQIREKSKKNL